MPVIVAFEGVAGTGKTYTCEKIQERYGSRVHAIEEFPHNFADGYLGKLSHLDPSFTLNPTGPTPLAQTFLFASNAAFKYETARMTSAKNVVIMDRYKHGIEAYQTNLAPEGKNKEGYISSVRSIVSSLPDPDIVVFFDTTMATIASRLSARSTNYDQGYIDFLDRSAHTYRMILANTSFPVIYISDVADVDESIERIVSQIPDINPEI